VTVYPLIMNQIEFRLVHNRGDNCHCDHIHVFYYLEFLFHLGLRICVWIGSQYFVCFEAVSSLFGSEAGIVNAAT